MVKHQTPNEEVRYSIGPVTFEQMTWKLRCDESEIRLHSIHQAALLEILCQNREKVVSKIEIYKLFYPDPTYRPDHKIIEISLCRLRKILERLNSEAPWYIHTVWGKGYMLSDSPMTIRVRNGSGVSKRMTGVTKTLVGMRTTKKSYANANSNVRPS